MLRCVSVRLGGAVTRSAAVGTAAGAKHRKVGRPPTSASPRRAASANKRGARSASKKPVAAKTGSFVKGANAREAAVPSARPAHMTEKREKEVLAVAERMRQRDVSGEVPVASFAFDILKAHPSVRDMGLRERMDFLCSRWAKLPTKKRMEYLNDPLKGLL